MKLHFYAIGSAVALGVAACGGGGGSSGDTNSRRSLEIKLHTDKPALPLNVFGYQAKIGSPYTNTLYVEVTRGDAPSTADAPKVGCVIVSGFESGALTYLDGNDEHYTEVEVNGVKDKVPTLYLSLIHI